MAVKYKLVEKKSEPSRKDSPKKWYANPQSSTALSGKAMTKAAAENTTLAPIELEAALDLLGSFIPQQLLQGHTVTLPGLGYFRLTFKSKGADTVKDFDPKELIYDVRPVFVPSKELRDRVRQGIEFEDGGVSKDGINYATRADYYAATGQVTVPGTGGGEEEEGGGNQQMG